MKPNGAFEGGDTISRRMTQKEDLGGRRAEATLNFRGRMTELWLPESLELEAARGEKRMWGEEGGRTGQTQRLLLNY